MKDTKAKVKTGRYGEDAACRYLESLGYITLTRNYKVRGGEIDIIMLHDGCAVFVEVKTRHGTNYGTAAEAVDSDKVSKMCTAAERYLYENSDDPRLCDIAVRFDVVEVYLDSRKTYINHIKAIDIN